MALTDNVPKLKVETSFSQILWAKFQQRRWLVFFKQLQFRGFYTLHPSEELLRLRTLQTTFIKSSSYHDLLQQVSRKLMNTLYDKRDDLSFLFVNIPFICGNSPLYMKFTYHNSYAKACQNYDEFLNSARFLIIWLLPVEDTFPISLQPHVYKFYVGTVGISMYNMRSEVFCVS